MPGERKDRCCRKRRCGWRWKGKKERYLQIGIVQVLEQLREYKRQWEIELNRTEFFFLNRFGERYSEQAARRMVKRYAELAMINLHVTPHMFRHAFATLLLEEEVDIRFIQKCQDMLPLQQHKSMRGWHQKADGNIKNEASEKSYKYIIYTNVKKCKKY